MVGNHEKPRRHAPARVEEPQKEHARGIGDRPFLCKRTVFAFSVAVHVGNGGYAWIRQDGKRLASSGGSPPCATVAPSLRPRNNSCGVGRTNPPRDGTERATATDCVPSRA